MAIPINLSDVYNVMVVLYVQDKGQIAVTVRRFKVTAITGTPSNQDLADGADSNWATNWKGVLAPDAKYLGTRVQSLEPNYGEAWADGIGGAGVGTFADAVDTGPGQLAALIRLFTGERGRKGEGRVYVGFPPLNAIDNAATPTAGYVTALATLGGILKNPFVASAAGGTITGKFGNWNKALAEFNEYVESDIPDAFATQRRRGSYGKLNIPPI